MLLCVPGFCSSRSKEAVIFDNFNTSAVTNAPTGQTIFKLNTTATITTVTTYHWNNGHGAYPGSISIKSPKGMVYGPFQCVSEVGQGGIANAFWTCHPNLALPEGRYEVSDSDASTWSTNGGSGFSGFCRVMGVPGKLAESPVADPTSAETTDIPRSKADKVVSYKDQLEVVVPPSVIGKGTKVTIAEIPKEQLIKGEDIYIAVPIGGFQIDMGNGKEFKDPVELKIKYNPKDLNPRYSAEEQIIVDYWNDDLRDWIPVSDSVDTNNCIISVHTKHLSPWRARIFGFSLRGAATTGLYTAGAAAVTYLGHMAYEKVALDIHSTNCFKILYEKKDIDSGSVNDKKWWLTNKDRPYKMNTPNFILDLGTLLDSALNSYRAAGFDAPYTPVEVKVNSVLIKSLGNPGGFEKWHRRIHINSALMKDSNMLKHVSAHEFFHRIQYLDIDAAPWWNDACAEYAACRIAWKLDDMGGGPNGVYPKLLSLPLPATGAPDPGLGDIEYDKGCFVEYLVKSGANFHEMWKYVADNYGGYEPVLDPLENYVNTFGKRLPVIYSDFAGWFLFSTESPIRALDPTKHCLDSLVMTLPLPAAKNSPAKTLELPFEVSENYSTSVKAVKVPSEPGKSSRTIVIESVAQNTGVHIDVYVLKDNAKVAGQPKPAAQFSEAGKSAVVEVGNKDIVYVVVTNPLQQAEEAKVRISDGSLSFTLKPTKIVEKQGDLKHEFTATVSSIPPSIKETTVEWTFGDKSEIASDSKRAKSGVDQEFHRKHEYPGGGLFNVVAALYDTSSGKKTLLDKATCKVDITVPPTLKLIPEYQSAKARAQVVFNAKVENGPKKPLFKWNFGDSSVGAKTNQPNSSHAYSQAKTYSVLVSLLDASNPKVVLADARGTVEITAPEKPAPKPVVKKPVKPAAKPKPVKISKHGPTWVLVDTKTYQSQTYNMADYSQQSGSGSNGSITSQEICSLGEGTQTTSCQMSWRFDTGKIDELIGGSTLKVTATLSGSGTGGLSGWVAFQAPDTPWNFWDSSLPCLVDLAYVVGKTTSGAATIPSGRKQGDRMLLRAHAGAGRSSITYDRIYEWK